ncbi:hypothetical protein DSO57_1030122 [Entomophthora muscae]|uniref:Uncharacterized protein n=1 Tax=Entomophthora muscae TaxID=34485 RepID=A0ACC2ULN1_9FUNG|nr:hypothetical protein DSO57_1030122 [Entomophthora muscae]
MHSVTALRSRTSLRSVALHPGTSCWISEVSNQHRITSETTAHAFALSSNPSDLPFHLKESS